LFSTDRTTTFFQYKSIDYTTGMAYAGSAQHWASAARQVSDHHLSVTGMLEQNAQNHGELAKAESTLNELEAKLQRMRGLLVERRTERAQLEQLNQEIAPTGDMDQLVSIQSRAVLIEKAIAELLNAEADCEHRIESARRYLYALYVRLERLRQDYSGLMRRVATSDQVEGIPKEVLANLGRIKIQLKAIMGEDNTGRL
jgi:chromosome segregation ATPase